MQVRTLKDKLKETKGTLEKNAEMIDYLNKSLSEAQKFSFKALLSNKQPNEISTSQTRLGAAVLQRSTKLQDIQSTYQVNNATFTP